MKTETKNVQKG